MSKCVILLAMASLSLEIYCQLPPGDPHWKLVFEESFDTLNSAVWKVAHEFDHYGEPQVYTNRPENVSLKEGSLVLQVQKERYKCGEIDGGGCNKARYDFTSGWIETRESLDIQYGYLESRIRVPHGHGFWPAFWTFVGENAPEDHNAAEIDIFEMLGNQPSNIMGTNLHLAYCNCNANECDCVYLNDMMCPEVDPMILCHGLDVEIPDYSLDYLTYGLEWTPSKIIWYVNGQMVRNADNPGITDPVRIIYNLAITPWNLPNRSTPFPSSMHIDYLRIYELNREADMVNDTIILGGEGQPAMIPDIEDVTFRANDLIEIRGAFTVPLGTALYLDVNSPD